jgi:hypothetical protein
MIWYGVLTGWPGGADYNVNISVQLLSWCTAWCRDRRSRYGPEEGLQKAGYEGTL